MIKDGLMRQVTTATLLSVEWTDETTHWEYDLTNSYITANSVVMVVVANTSADHAGMLLPTNDSYDGGVIIYAESQPEADIDISYTIHETKDITPT
jgi:hypothetical protein